MSVVMVVIATTTANGSASKPGKAAPTDVLGCVGTPQPREKKLVGAPAAKEVWTPAPTQQRQEVACREALQKRTCNPKALRKARAVRPAQAPARAVGYAQVPEPAKAASTNNRLCKERMARAEIARAIP